MYFNKPLRIVIAFIALSFLGIGAIPLLKVNLSPSIQENSLSISYSLPQSSPDIVERLATSPLEGVVSQISGIEEIYSISSYNGGRIRLSLDKDVDLSFKKFEVSTAIRNVYPNLPQNLTYPLIQQSGGDDNAQDNSPILIYAVNAPYAASKIQNDVEELVKNPLSQINEIQSIELTGGNSLQVTIAFDYLKMQRYGLSKRDIQQALSTASSTSFIGLSDIGNGQQFFLYTNGDIAKVEELEGVTIAKVAKQDILLKDMADVYLEERPPSRYRRINGQNAIYLNVTAREGVNKIVLAEQIKAEIESLTTFLPEGYELRLEVDDTEQLKEELDKIYLRSALSIAILLLFILISKRNGRYLLALFLGLLVNLCLTAIIIYGLGVELHLYSIAGLTISFGLIVDNAIVMMDHMHKFKNRKVFLALMAASLTTIMALLMVLLLPEEDRTTLTDFSIVVAINLGVSLLIALLFTPALYQVLFGGREGAKASRSIRSLRRGVRGIRIYSRSIFFMAKHRKAFVFLLILGFGLPVFKLPVTWEGQEWYNESIGSDTYQDEIRPISDKVLGGALRKFVTEVYEGYSYRSPERTRLMVTAALPFGTTLEDTNYAILMIENYLSQVEGLDKYVSSVSGRNGRIEITFKPEYDDSALPYQLKGRLQARALDLTGVRWSVSGVGRGFSGGGESTDRPSYRVKMKGYNYDQLEEQANTLAKMLVDGNPRVQEVKTNEQIGWGRERTSEYRLRFNANLMARSGYSRGQVMQTLNNLAKSSGSSLSANFKGERLPVVINAKTANEFSKWDLMQEPLALDTTKRLKIKDYAELSFEETANELHKEDRQYLRVIAFDYLGSGRFGRKYLDEQLDSMKTILPVGYTAESSGGYFSFGREKRQYGLLGFLILGVFFICAILFENLKQPFYIIATIPISFIGLFLIFSLFDFRFDQGGYAAFVLLGGLVVNAAIFIVNDLNNARKKAYNRTVIKSVMGKAQPIILTVLSTCFGLIPFLLEGDNEIFWFALAIGTIGGLLFSLFAVFVCLPVFLNRKSTLA